MQYGGLVFILRRVEGAADFAASGSKIVKRLRRRNYYPAIIEKTIGLVPSTTLYRFFIKNCILTNKGDYVTGLVKTSSEKTRP